MKVENMSEQISPPTPRYVTYLCQHCSGKIEFDANQLDTAEKRTVPCPHCGMETIIFVPEQQTPPVSPSPVDSEDEIAERRAAAKNVMRLRRDAAKGDSIAQCLLGYAYQNGEGVPKNDSEAVKWFRMSAEQGNTTAQGELGTAYSNGCGVPQDRGEGMKWWSKAAEQGDAIAQCLLGFAYYNGQGIPKDYVEAAKWFRLSATQGHAGSQFGLALAYAMGRGVPQNYLEAYKYANLSAAKGFTPAVKIRDDLAEKLSPSQLLECQREATEEALSLSDPTNAVRQSDPERSVIPSEVRREVWRRDGGKCVKCGSRVKLEYDHIIPVSKGGSNTARNIELLCEVCNRAKRASIQ